MPPERCRIMLAIAPALAAAILVSAGQGHAADGPQWATGASLQKSLSQKVDILWSGNPLRQAIGSLSRAQRVAFLVDRRVDPGQKLDLRFDGVPMETVLMKIANSCGAGVSRLGSVVYLGPAYAAEQLPVLANECEKNVRRLPAATQRKFLQTKPLVWDDLSSPRDLMAGLGQQGGIKIAGLEQVPHDLWAAADLPPLSLVDRLTLVAVQFDLTFTVAADGTQIELVPVPANLRGAAANRSPPVAPQVLPKRPAAKPPGTEKTLIKRFEVQQKPLGLVLRELASKLDLELKIDEPAIQAAGVSLDQRVSATVENATVDEALRKLLESTGLTFRRRQKTVQIVPVN